MTTVERNPPPWAEGLLRSLLRPCDREAISGDLLEEYRAVRRPQGGAVAANVWYLKQILSLLWPMVWPMASVLAAQSVFLALTVFRPGHHAPQFEFQPRSAWFTTSFQILWFGSIVGAPGVSIFDGALYFFAAYRAVARTGLIRTGVVVAGAVSVAGGAVLFAAAAMVTPSLAISLFTQLFLLLILTTYVCIPLIYASVVGVLAGLLWKWRTPPAARAAAGSRTRRESPELPSQPSRMLRGVLVTTFVFLTLPVVITAGRIGWWACFGGPPLDMDTPRDGQVVAHIDVLSRIPPDIAGMRIMELKSHSIVWYAKPLGGRSECWNGCWNLRLRVGENPASFTAGKQEFAAQFPDQPTFWLLSGTTYVFEVWDSKGRIERARFAL